MQAESRPVPFCCERYDDLLGFVVSQSGYRLGRSLASAIKRAGFRITSREFAILNRLQQHGPLNQSQIAQATFKDRPATSRMIDKLEALGYVERHASREPGRAFDISLTRAGKEVRDRIVPVAVENIESGCRGISSSDLLVTLRTLQLINSRLVRDSVR